MDDIKGFKDEFRWLSNFYPAPILWHGYDWPSVEHAYVAHKVLPAKYHEAAKKVCHMTAGQAKRWGRKQTLRPDWDKVKIPIMRALQQCKYEQWPWLGDKLLATEDCHIEETNAWGDTFWGVCGTEGENHMGKIVMEIRDFLRKT